MKIDFSLPQLEEVAQKIIAHNPNKVILFEGDMGVGKTTLIKQLCKNLGVTATTSSPTFALVNEYETNSNDLLYHFDFYRLNTEIEALDMGIEEYLYSGNWCFIEWPEKIPNLIPTLHTCITLSLLANGQRSLVLK